MCTAIGYLARGEGHRLVLSGYIYDDGSGFKMSGYQKSAGILEDHNVHPCGGSGVHSLPTFVYRQAKW